MIFVKWAGSEEQSGGQPVCTDSARSMAELQRPKTFDLDRLAGCRMKQANSFEFTIRSQRIWIKRVNATVSEIAHEQIATKPAKACGRQCQPLRRIEFTRGRDALNQVAVQVISVDETIQ